MEQRRHARRFFDLACDGTGAGGAADAMAGCGTVSEDVLCNNAPTWLFPSVLLCSVKLPSCSDTSETKGKVLVTTRTRRFLYLQYIETRSYL